MVETVPIPAEAVPYKRTALFTKQTVPAALIKDHSIKAGVWGLLHVTTGALDFIVPSLGASHRVVAGETHVVEPELLHRVSLSENTEFFVEFWR